MARVSLQATQGKGQAVFLCDVSPPRGADPSFVEAVRWLDADFLCVAYNPGRSVRVTSAIAAAIIRQHTCKEVLFSLACRDMNKLALQSYLLGAHALGLQNVVVVKGDDFTEKDLAAVRPVHDITTTELVRAIKSMNEGIDYKGLRLRAPTDFCVGATLDLGKGVEREARLVQRKVSAGAEFLITQSLYDVSLTRQFLDVYQSLGGEALQIPVFYGIQVMEKDGLLFGDIPPKLKEDLERGRPGTDIALELLHRFVESGFRSFYLVPPILKGGVRDYEAAQRVLEAFRRGGA